MPDEKTLPEVSQVSIQRQTAMTGEFVTITTNAPKGITAADLAGIINLIGDAINSRLQVKNTEVQKRTGKNLKEMGYSDEQLERLNLSAGD